MNKYNETGQKIYTEKLIATSGVQRNFSNVNRANKICNIILRQKELLHAQGSFKKYVF